MRLVARFVGIEIDVVNVRHYVKHRFYLCEEKVEKVLVSFELKNKNFGRVKSLIICRKRSCRYHAAPPEKIKYFQCLNCKNIFILLAIHQLLFQNFQNSMYANVD